MTSAEISCSTVTITTTNGLVSSVGPEPPWPVGCGEIIVGTGGTGHYAFNTVRPGSQVRNNTSFGVIVVGLNASSYSWSFRPVAGSTFTDSGTGAC